MTKKEEENRYVHKRAKTWLEQAWGKNLLPNNIGGEIQRERIGYHKKQTCFGKRDSLWKKNGDCEREKMRKTSKRGGTVLSRPKGDLICRSLTVSRTNAFVAWGGRLVRELDDQSFTHTDEGGRDRG